MRGIRTTSRGALLVGIGLGLFICHARVAECEINHGVIWYSPASTEEQLQRAAQRYDVGIGGLEDPHDNIEIKRLHPDFRWFIYNSVTDNYAPPFHSQRTPEHDALASLASQRGWDVEEAYLHYYDDTHVVVGGSDTLFIPGWQGGTATVFWESRVPVYYANRSRIATNFSTPRSRLLHKKAMIGLALDTPFEESEFYPDGIFCDNSMSKFLKSGKVLSGGRVLEAPGHPRIDSKEFLDWRWDQAFGVFLTELKDTLETAASWSHDGKRKYLMLNISSFWDSTFVTKDAADILFLEFEYNPVKAARPNFAALTHQRDVFAAAAGVTFFYAPTMTRTVPGKPGEYDYAEILLGNLAWYLISRTQDSMFFNFGTAMPSVAGWDTLNWRGSMDTVDEHLGDPDGEPFTLTTGTDPLGNPYSVVAREYANGLVLIRNRGDGTQGIEPATAVHVPLPRPLYRINPAGSIGSVITDVVLRNGQGAIFLNGPTSGRRGVDSKQ